MKFLFLACMLTLVGCATPPPPLSTPSGNPEVTIQGVSKKQVLDRIVNGTVSKGMQIKSVTDYGVVVTKRMTDFASTFVYGSRYDGVPEVRLAFTVIESGGAVKVLSRAEMVTNPGSAYERSNDVTQREGSFLQTELEQLKISFTGTPITPTTCSAFSTACAKQ